MMTIFKKIFLVLLLACVLAVMNVSLAVNEIEDKAGGKNLLNLKTVYQKNNDDFGHSQHHIIAVQSGETYTIVMDQAYVNGCEAELHEFEYEEYPSGNGKSVYYSFDENNQRTYAEFIPLETHILIFSIPVPKGPSVTSYNVMLYQGDYASFTGFEPYVPEGFEFEEKGTLAVDYDDMMTLAEVTSLVQAEDGYGHVIETTIISDTFSMSDRKPGTYEMIFEASSNQITRRYVLDITIYDGTPPVIEGPDELTIEISEKIDASDIHAMYTVSDNVDENIALNVDLNTYTHADQLKTYWIHYSATDSSGNTTTKEVPITLVDTTPPKLTGPIDLYIYTTDEPYVEQDIIDTFSANDFVDGDCEVIIDENDYQSTQVAGIYEVTVKTSDTLGNETSQIVYIHVIDNQGPIFVTDELIIETTASKALSLNDVLNQFEAHMTQLNKKPQAIGVKYNEYEHNENKAGEYYVYLSYELDGNEETSRVLVRVLEETPSFSPYYLFGVIPIVGVVVFILKKKKMF